MVFPTLVVGAEGFIGKHLYRFYRNKGTHYRPIDGLLELNLERPLCNFPLSGYQYAIIAAGVADPLACEKNPDYTRLINVENTLRLGNQFLKNGMIPIFFSSDYVFDGEKGDYTIDSPCNPLNAYGRQKYELEVRALSEFRNQCIIVRLSKVYGFQVGDGSLFENIASQLARGIPVFAAADQIFKPISVDDVINGIDQLQCKGETGLFQFAGSEKISRYQLAMQVAVKLKKEDLVQKISLDDIPGVIRPKDTSMMSYVKSTHTISKTIDTIIKHYCHG